jgi:hypothetical protein
LVLLMPQHAEQQRFVVAGREQHGATPNCFSLMPFFAKSMMARHMTQN